MLCVMPINQRSATLLEPMKQEIHFVTGKGGVGKSVLAAALALKKSQEGKNTLLVELGDQSFFKDFFGLPQVGFQPVTIRPLLSVALWTGEACLQEYARHFIKVESLAKLFFENAVMKAFINVAPALPELAILGKVTSGPRKHGPPLPFDCIVVDAFATGHFIALLEAPKGMAEAVQFGPMGEQSRSIDAHIRNPEICKYHVVTLPEELPLKEASELVARLKNEFGVTAELIMNKMIEAPVSEKTLQEVQAENSDLSKFAEYLDGHIRRQNQMWAQAQELSPQVIRVPLYFESSAWALVEKTTEVLK
ncbi:ArsA-related P-loop ATPase [Bdellovibrio bacteriovorus]|uniref:arsenite-transporting ATPase n=1 Tax=Bdellovibrio bacteriovorus (strain ATCC 15356 / DSM 50701 / NCIMB 9529 / HD100) TaxID=264462 RepID=Q6MH02_BDEBA|nr:putative arsenical pump-driving ATPase [Bdellovibrio bacteriovorus HD100]